MSRPEPTPVTEPEQFVELFVSGWQAPKPDGFLRAFMPVLHPEVRLVQPTIPPQQGHDEFERSFRNLFRILPDYSVTVEDWAAREQVVYLSLVHSATVGRRHRSWPGVDRVTLVDGLIRERIAYFDPTALFPALLLAPRTWPQLISWTMASTRS